MSNGVKPEEVGRVVRGVGLDEELKIRRELPPRVKKYILEHMDVPIPWSWIWNKYQLHGEAGVMTILIKANAMTHSESYGDDYYRSLSLIGPYSTKVGRARRRKQGCRQGC